ncbi:MAG TPA: DegT/DnrJ/EryC1/StrS aminotransferase family protein [Gemmataceae bacterium]|nr:DegT/DnrJ/EryC1/StrS aminotransferase family protein [Gemmataceae bacterium]
MVKFAQPQPIACKKIPFFRPSITEAEIAEVVGCLRSGWLTTGPLTRRFEEEFAQAVGARHAVAVNSCTAALHLAVEALGLRPGQAVLVPTMTFAATAEIVRYQGAVPILVDCDPITQNIDLVDAAHKVEMLRAGRLPGAPANLELVGIIPVHVSGLMLDMDAVQAFARQHQLWVVEDAAHAFPAAWRPARDKPWQRCGEGTATVTCFSFYANKTITTGEGGMAVTEDADLTARIRQMSLHGLSRDAWSRYAQGGSWDYQIVAPGYKYNLTDVASALGIHQLQRAEPMRRRREALAQAYRDALGGLEELELPPNPPNRLHSWHLLPVRLRLERLGVDRNTFMRALNEHGISCSVHWRPLHLHPYYREQFGWQPELLPVASREWPRLISLPLFPDMQDEERDHVIDVVRHLCQRFQSVPSACN